MPAPLKYLLPPHTEAELLKFLLGLTADQRTTVRSGPYAASDAGFIEKLPGAFDYVERKMREWRDDGSMPFDHFGAPRGSTVVGEGWPHIKAFAERLVEAYRHDCWQGQPRRVRVTVEKAGMLGVVSEVAREYGITSYAFTGFSGFGVLSEIGKWAGKVTESGAIPTLVHFGDFDASGCYALTVAESTIRKQFPGIRLKVIRGAVRPAQIRKHTLPTRPAKDDSPHDAVAAWDGKRCVELDSLAARGLLRSVVKDAIWTLVKNRREWDRQKAIEEEERERFRKLTDSL